MYNNFVYHINLYQLSGIPNWHGQDTRSRIAATYNFCRGQMQIVSNRQTFRKVFWSPYMALLFICLVVPHMGSYQFSPPWGR